MSGIRDDGDIRQQPSERPCRVAAAKAQKQESSFFFSVVAGAGSWDLLGLLARLYAKILKS
eukprot:scaffold4604_cov257-Pinguiococcus_pyrenoidosus.AAC.2